MPQTASRAIPWSVMASGHLFSPDPARLLVAEHQLLVHELVNTSATGNLPEGPMSAGWVVIPPTDSTDSHYHPKSWAYVIVLASGPEGAVTQLGEEMEEVIVQFPWQLVAIPPGRPHRAHNPSPDKWVVAMELRDCGSVFDDRLMLRHLNAIPLPQYTRPPRPRFRMPRLGRRRRAAS